MDLFTGILTTTLFIVVGIYLFSLIRRLLVNRRESFIEQHVFPETLRVNLRKRYPHLSEHECSLVMDGLVDYFCVCLRAGRKMIAMPSQAVDAVWHEYILFTQDYQLFCKKAFGRFLHHAPAEAMKSPTHAQKGIKRAWRIACFRESINPKTPNKLPLLFALDGMLNIEDGFEYSLKCMGNKNEYCASHIGCGGAGCGGVGCSSGCGAGCGGCGGG